MTDDVKEAYYDMEFKGIVQSTNRVAPPIETTYLGKLLCDMSIAIHGWKVNREY